MKVVNLPGAGQLETSFKVGGENLVKTRCYRTVELIRRGRLKRARDEPIDFSLGEITDLLKHGLR